MVDSPKDGALPSSEPETQPHVKDLSSGPSSAAHTTLVSSREPFAAMEPPTLSSPASEPRPTRVMELETRVQTLESHVEAMERELGEVYGATEHLVRSNESLQRALQQQRHGRYIMWGTLIAMLVILWLALRSRLGVLGPG